jgi:two-component system NtrC family sensor kinase
VVDVGISLAESDAGMSRMRRGTYWAAILAVAAVAAGVATLARRLVVVPVGRLVEGTRHVGGGNLEHRIAQSSQDELGQLAASFNGMTQSLLDVGRERDALLGSLERQVEERTAALRKTQSQLVQSEKLASLGRLAASIAHEINNPLAGILTFARLQIRVLEEDRALSEEVRHRHVAQLRLVQREAERCTAIVRNLLDFARQRPLKPTRFAPAALVDEALSLVGHQLTLKGIEVELSVAAAPQVEADFGQLRQAFVNVALNAADAMPEGGRMRVSVAGSPDGSEVDLTVEDQGTGIAPEDLQKIFDPFFSTKDHGTGLGLSVVYGIVERHGGRLDIDSEPGRGTRVRIRLPAAAEPPEPES